MTGGILDKNIKEITKINLEYNDQLVNQYQKEKLALLLKDISKNVTFYKNYNENTDYRVLPIVNKNFINDNYDDFLSRKYQKEKLKKISTSGSTGVPFVIYQNPKKVKRQIADLLNFNELCGYKFGQRLIYLRIWNDINKISFLKRRIKNILPVNTENLSIEKTKLILNNITASRRPYSLLTYASSLELLEQNLEEMNISRVHGKISCIITMAEALTLNTKKKIESIFGCSVYSRYSNSENGFIAHQIPGSDEYYIVNNASFFVEFLDFNSDVSVPDGHPGRIVVTDLFNDAFPLIRYDTGDVGVRNRVNGKILIERIEGRKLDFIYSTNLQPISPHVVDYSLRMIIGIKQFQLIQIGNAKYTLRLNVKVNVDKNHINDIAVQNLRLFLGKTADIFIEFVDEIPFLDSGKRRIVINQWKKE
jgi:phenylacetate-CoA ligase